MRERILILIICVIINSVTAPAPFNLLSTNLPYPKSTTPPTPKLPKWSDYTSKNSAGKPMKDNAYLASLVKKPPNDNKIKIETKKAVENKTNIEETECFNTTKVLFAAWTGLTEKESKEVKTTDIKSQEDPKFESNVTEPSKGVKLHELLSLKPKVNIPENQNKKEVKSTDVKSKENPKFKSNVTEPRKGVKLHELFKPLSLKHKMNITENQNKTFEIPPTMIPIFRPNPNLVKSQITKEDLAIITTVPKSVAPVEDLPASVAKADYAIPPNEAQPNLNTNVNAIPFNIPCHKASDVLDEAPAKPEILRASHAKLNPIPNAKSPVLQEPNRVEKPEKLETDESVAIIFKPKNISLLNVYGDMLKKITLTVLVPYHISKLGT